MKNYSFCVGIKHEINRKLLINLLKENNFDILEFSNSNIPNADIYIIDTYFEKIYGDKLLNIKKSKDVFLPILLIIRKNTKIEPWIHKGYDYIFKEPISKIIFQLTIKYFLQLREQSIIIKNKQKEILNAIFENSGSANIIIDEKTTILMANKACLSILGYSPDELIGTSWTQYISSDILPDMLDYCKMKIEGEKNIPSQYEIKLINKNREIRYAIITTGRVPNTKNFIVSIIDITNQKRMELSYEILNSISKLMLNSIDLSSMVYIIKTEIKKLIDTENFLFLIYDEKNNKFIEPAENIEIDINKNPLIKYVINKKESVFLKKENIKDLIKNNVLKIENRIPELWIGIPIIKEKKVIGLMVFYEFDLKITFDRDIIQPLEIISTTLSTYIIRKNEELIKERLKTAIEQSSDAIFITDINGTIEYINPAFEKITGYSKTEILGKNPRILKSGKHTKEFYEKLWNTILSGKTWNGKFINRKKDGTLYTEQASISPVFDSSGKIINFVAVKRDITKEEELKQQLLHSQKMDAIGRLSGGIAHDFNNMLNVIIGYGELLLRRLHKDDPIIKYVKQILKAADRSANLTRQLLAFSRKQPMQLKVININNVILDTEKMLSRIIGEDINMELLLTKDIPNIKIDPNQLSQILLNLTINARDAMPEGGKLKIKTEVEDLSEFYSSEHIDLQPGKYIILSVEDTGCGMDKETQNKIFEPFFTTKEKGTGLGLSVVYGIVKQCGGDIHVYSEVGKGTIFKIYFPAVDEKEEQDDIKPKEIKSFIKKSHILVIEDEESLREIIGEMLSSLNYKVTLAANAGEALLLIEEKDLKPDLILTDVIMPNMSGKEVINRIKRKLPEVKVIFMSGYDFATINKQGIIEDDVNFIQKPFTLKDISEKIESVMFSN